MAKKVVGFGDMLLSLSPRGYYRFIQANEAELFYTGAEANVLAELSQFGAETELVTRLPENAIAEAAIASLRKYRIGTRFIARGGERMGVIYTERGAAQRPSSVVYDRAHSAICEAECGVFDWDAIFAEADWFHFTGITPALSDTLPAVCLEALRAAKRHGVTVSCDLNYRKKLWSTEKAGRVMDTLLPFVNVLIANEEDAEKVLGLKAEGTDVAAAKLSHAGYVGVAQKIMARYGVSTVATTLRQSLSASDNNWSAMMYQNGQAYFSREYAIHIVNRVGGGDSFSGGLIYALREGMGAREAVEFAAAASCLKHSIEQDFNLVSVSDVRRLMAGDGSGRVQR